MSDKLRLFLAHSFAAEKFPSKGFPDNSAISDIELADLVSKWIFEFSGGQIEVVRTRDPHQDYISSQVRRDICSADLILCLFTKRVKDCIKEQWLPSTYVISEAAAGLMQFSSEEGSHRRLYGLIEEGVDREQLGMAFHQNKTAVGFLRSDQDGLRCRVREIVKAILGANSVQPRNDREYLSGDKTVTVWRNGAVTVECRHRFRFTKELQKITIPHAIWRISEPLPPIEVLLNGDRDIGLGYLRCVPINCGSSGQKTCHYKIVPREPSLKNEHLFDIEFWDLDIHAGDELIYEIAWGYRNAFRDPTKHHGKPNTVGLRTGERGIAKSLSLTLQFQRDLTGASGETVPALDQSPTLFTIDTPILPADRRFWHESSAWQERETLLPCHNKSGAMSEIYSWKSDCFVGTVKAAWIPHFSYLQGEGAGETQTQLKNPVV